MRLQQPKVQRAGLIKTLPDHPSFSVVTPGSGVAAPTIPPELITLVKEYLTPLGPGVKEECLAASNEYLALLNVSQGRP